MIKVSVIVPIFNAEEFLEETLCSLSMQNFTDAEFICVDDGSTDRSVEIYEKIAQNDGRFKLLKQPNSGPASARNLGIDNAAGEYICFVDSDDILEENALETMYEMSKKSNCDILVHTATTFGSTEVPDWVSPLLKINNRKISDFKISDIFSVNGCRPFLWLHFIKSSIIKDNHLKINENLTIGEDQAFEISYFSYAKNVLFTDLSLYRYRIGNSNSLMGKFNGRLMEKMQQHIGMIDAVISSLDGKMECRDECEVIYWVLDTVYWDLIRLLYYDQAKFTPRVVEFLKRLNADKHYDNLKEPYNTIYDQIMIVNNFHDDPDRIIQEFTKQYADAQDDYQNTVNKPSVKLYLKLRSFFDKP
ncbi:glycosyltransferase family 2 protein [Methanomethylophilus alvi]|uniref:glycosyltransferase family 2 protein n=1 Tax=Methanomethylophilus alvi TaxID=1291540 RepID=UPI0037DDCD55